jgi:hypothetical protein
MGDVDNNDAMLEAAEWLRQEFVKARGKESVRVEVRQQGQRFKKIGPAKLVIKKIRGQ